MRKGRGSGAGGMDTSFKSVAVKKESWEAHGLRCFMEA